MKTEAVVAQSWDDLVFENRNKEYGAYSVRRSYSDRVIYALFMSLSAMVLAILAPALLALLKGEKIEGHMPIFDPSPGVIFKEKPVIIQVKQPSKTPSHPPVRNVNHDIIPVVTTAEVPVTEIKPEDQTTIDFTELGELDGSGTSENPVGNTGTVAETTDKTIYCKFNPVQVSPEYIGGENAMGRFLQKVIRYPASARRLGVDGIVFVSFIINDEGKITNTEVVKGINADCDAEALRVVNLMPLWKPGRQNNNPVSVRMVLPIRFKIEI